MLCPSPPCAHGLARDVGGHRATRLIPGVVCVLALTFALPAVAHASSRAPGSAPGIAAAPRLAAAPDTADGDLFGTSPVLDTDRTPYDSTDLMLDEIGGDDDDGRERRWSQSHHEYALGLRRQSHAWKGSLTLDGLLPHQFLIDSARRL